MVRTLSIGVTICLLAAFGLTSTARGAEDDAKAAAGVGLVVISAHPILGTRLPQEFEQHASSMQVMTPMWFEAGDDGTVRHLPAVAGQSFDAYRQAMAKRGVKLVPILRNFAPQPMLASPQAIERCVEQAIALVKLHQFDGLMIDFEQLKRQSAQPLVSLSMKLYEELRKMDKMFLNAVAPKAWEQEYDYVALAKHCDYLYLMTYDYVGPWHKTPGPTAPITWKERPRDIDRDLRAVLAMGVPSGKMLLGIPLYGNEFLLDDEGKTTTVTPHYVTRLQKLRERVGADARWDDEKQCSWFEYTADGKRRQVWHDDLRSYLAKLDVVREHKLAGIAAWALRYADEPTADDFWQALGQRTTFEAVPAGAAK